MWNKNSLVIRFLILSISLFCADGWSRQRVLLLGTLCLPRQLNGRALNDDTELFNETCAKSGGIDEQLKFLADHGPNLRIDKIAYFEGLGSTSFFDYLKVSEQFNPEEHPFEYAGKLWRLYIQFVFKRSVFEESYRNFYQSRLKVLETYCEISRCQILWVESGAESKSGNTFSSLARTKPWKAALYTAMLPRMSFTFNLSKDPRQNLISVSHLSLSGIGNRRWVSPNGDWMANETVPFLKSQLNSLFANAKQ